MLVSFLGSLPLGTLNIAAMQISITDGHRPALWFAAGILLVEIIYVRISLVAMDKIRKQEKVLKALEWITLLIVVALAVSSFVAAAKNSAHAKNILLSNSMPRFVLGLLMSALNPVQIPFWFGWSTVLFTKKILLPTTIITILHFRYWPWYCHCHVCFHFWRQVFCSEIKYQSIYFTPGDRRHFYNNCHYTDMEDVEKKRCSSENSRYKRGGFAPGKVSRISFRQYIYV
jgi:threonine/homoserine/homoserine lactone efflux protein